MKPKPINWQIKIQNPVYSLVITSFLPLPSLYTWKSYCLISLPFFLYLQSTCSQILPQSHLQNCIFLVNSLFLLPHLVQLFILILQSKFQIFTLFSLCLWDTSPSRSAPFKTVPGTLVRILHISLCAHHNTPMKCMWQWITLSQRRKQPGRTSPKAPKLDHGCIHWAALESMLFPATNIRISSNPGQPFQLMSSLFWILHFKWKRYLRQDKEFLQMLPLCQVPGKLCIYSSLGHQQNKPRRSLVLLLSPFYS